MDQQGIVDINSNDELRDVIRKTNTNFRLLKNHIANRTSQISADIDIDMDDITDAINGIIDDFTSALNSERQARQDKDTEIERGYCPLDQNGLVDSQHLPSYVDDVIDSYPVSGSTELSAGWLSRSPNGSAFVPETDKIYVLVADSASYEANSQFRWSGSTYVSITADQIEMEPLSNLEIEELLS